MSLLVRKNNMKGAKGMKMKRAGHATETTETGGRKWRGNEMGATRVRAGDRAAKNRAKNGERSRKERAREDRDAKGRRWRER